MVLPHAPGVVFTDTVINIMSTYLMPGPAQQAWDCGKSVCVWRETGTQLNLPCPQGEMEGDAPNLCYLANEDKHLSSLLKE